MRAMRWQGRALCRARRAARRTSVSRASFTAATTRCSMPRGRRCWPSRARPAPITGGWSRAFARMVKRGELGAIATDLCDDPERSLRAAQRGRLRQRGPDRGGPPAPRAGRAISRLCRSMVDQALTSDSSRRARRVDSRSPLSHPRRRVLDWAKRIERGSRHHGRQREQGDPGRQSRPRPGGPHHPGRPRRSSISRSPPPSAGAIATAARTASAPNGIGW